MKLSDHFPDMKDWTPAKKPDQANPQIPTPEVQSSPYLRAPLPLPMQYAPDTLKQYNKPGLSSFRTSPIPPSGYPAVNSASAGVTKILQGQAGAAGAAGTSGTGNMTFRGQWNNFTTYAVNDVVLDNISTYIAVAENSNSEPDLGSASWNLLGKNLNFRGEWASSTSPASVTFVQSAGNNGGAGPLSQAFSNPNAAGNTILVYVEASHSFGSGHPDPAYSLVITDTQGNTYSQIGAAAGNSNTTLWKDVGVFVATNVKAGANTVTFTVVGGNPNPAGNTLLTISEYTGSSTVYPIVDIESAVLSTPPPATISNMTVSVSTGQPNQVVVLFSGALMTSGGETPPAGFSTRGAGYYDKIIPTASTAAYNLSYSGTTTIGIVFGLALTNVAGSGYVPFDLVIYRGSTYVCIKATTGSQPPTNSIYWTMISQGTGGVIALAANYSIVATDDGQLISNSTSSNFTAKLLASPPYLGWWAAFQNSSTGTLIVDPNGATLDGSASTFTLNKNQGMLVYTDGANYFTERGIGTISSLPSIFNVSSTGAATLANQNTNTVFAGPASGPATTPTFRTLTAADIPVVIPSFNRKVISTTTYTTISSDVSKALDVQTSSATTITLQAVAPAPALIRNYGFNRLAGVQTTGTLSVTLTAGDLAVITVEWYVNGTNTITDTITVTDANGNTWNKVPNTFVTNPNITAFGSGAGQQLWYSNITSGGAGVTITATFPLSVQYPALYGAEASNVTLVDQSTNNQGNGVPSSGNITTTAASTFVYGSVYDDAGGSSAAGTGWTLLQTQFNQYLNEYRLPIVTGTFAANSNQAGTVQFTATIVAFMAAAFTPFSGFIQNNGTAVVALTPSSGLINGAASINLFPGQGVTIATDGTNFTAVTWDSGVVAAVDLTAQGAAIGATTIYAVPTGKAGMYHISWSAKITRAATTSSTLAGANGFQITYTDANDSVVVTPLAKPNAVATGNTTGVQLSGIEIANAKAGTNIQYQIDYTSVGGTTMQYNLHIKVEYLGS